MEKYRHAYKHWIKLVSYTKEKDGGLWADAARSWWQYLHGIIEVAIYDLSITAAEFAEILSWSVNMDNEDACKEACNAYTEQ